MSWVESLYQKLACNDTTSEFNYLAYDILYLICLVKTGDNYRKPIRWENKGDKADYKHLKALARSDGGRIPTSA